MKKVIENQFVKNGGYAVITTDEYDELDNDIKQRYWIKIDATGKYIMLEEPSDFLDMIEYPDNFETVNALESDCVDIRRIVDEQSIINKNGTD